MTTWIQWPLLPDLEPLAFTSVDIPGEVIYGLSETATSDTTVPANADLLPQQLILPGFENLPELPHENPAFVGVALL